MQVILRIFRPGIWYWFVIDRSITFTRNQEADDIHRYVFTYIYTEFLKVLRSLKKMLTCAIDFFLKRRKKKSWTHTAILWRIAIHLLFKYSKFICQSFNKVSKFQFQLLFRESRKIWDFSLPLPISFPWLELTSWVESWSAWYWGSLSCITELCVYHVPTNITELSIPAVLYGVITAKQTTKARGNFIRKEKYIFWLRHQSSLLFPKYIGFL